MSDITYTFCTLSIPSSVGGLMGTPWMPARPLDKIVFSFAGFTEAIFPPPKFVFTYSQPSTFDVPTLGRQLEILTEARGHVAKSWVPYRLWTDGRYGSGGVCAEGGIFRASKEDENTVPLRHRMHRVAERLYPDWDRSVVHKISGQPYLNMTHVYVNNELGQEAILKVFDEAIRELEEEIAKELVESAAGVEIEKVKEEELVSNGR